MRRLPCKRAKLARGSVSVTLLVFLLLGPLPDANAKADPSNAPALYRNSLQANPFWLALGWMHLAYARTVSEHVVVSVEPGVVIGRPGFVATADLRARWYFIRPAPSGPYVSLFSRLVFERRDSWNRDDWNPGAVVGWSWVKGRISARLGVGVQGMVRLTEHDSKWKIFDLPPVLPCIEAAIGISF
jgi:hypothetical protein